MGKVADKVGFTRKALTYWADQGYITSYRVRGHACIVNIEEVQQYAQQRRIVKQSRQAKKAQLSTPSAL